MTSPDDDQDKTEPVIGTVFSEDLWEKYKKVRRVGRIEKIPATFIPQRNSQFSTVSESSNLLTNQKALQSILSTTQVTSINEICSSDSFNIKNSTVANTDNGSNQCDCYGAGDGLVADKEFPNNMSDTSTREKKNSISISIHEEIRRSFSKTRSLSVSVIKNIFKKSKSFHSSSDTLISSRHTNHADAIIPNFIFKYHTEDVDDPLPQSAKTGWVRQCWSAFSMGLNTLVCGILLGLMSSNDSIMMTIKFCSRGQQELLLTWLKYAFVIGCTFSCFLCWQIINYFGRRVTNLLFSLILLISFTLFIVSEESTHVVIGFALGGVSSSSCFINSYFYLPECVEEKMFIPTSVIFTCMLFIGIYISNLVLMLFSFHYLVYVSIFLLFLSLVFVFLLPESPAFYFKKNDLENARKSISWFKDRENELLVSYEMTIVLSKFTEKNKSLSWSCFRSKANINALYFSFVLMIATALNTCVFFKLYPPISNLFVGSLGPFGVNSIIFILPVSILIASIQVLVTSKRKKLLVTSYTLVTISLILLSILYNFVSFRGPGDDIGQMFIDWLILLSFVLFSVSFLLSSFIVPHVIYFEIFSHETMSSCLSVLYAFGSLLTLLLVSLSRYIYFIGFGTCLCLMSLFFLTLVKIIIIYLPETKGEVFQKIRKKFRRIKKITRSKKVSIFTIGDGEIDV